MNVSNSLRRCLFAAVLTVVGVALVSPAELFAQTTTPDTTDTALPSPADNVSGGALSARAPGNWVSAGIAKYTANRDNPPVEDNTGDEFKFKRELLNSVLGSFFDTLNTFLGLGSLLGGGTASLGDINIGDVNFNDLAGALAANAVQAAVDTTVEAGQQVVTKKLEKKIDSPLGSILVPTLTGSATNLQDTIF